MSGDGIVENILKSSDPSGAGLMCSKCEAAAQLEQLPLWALEVIEAIYRELDETASASIVGKLAEKARVRGYGAGAWIASFDAGASMRSDRRTLPEHADCTPLDVDRVAAHIMPNGTFARLMPGYESRAGQVEMLRAVTCAFNEGTHLVVEAGTGIGKSLAYLIPAVFWAKLNDVPVVISTNTRNLQSQLIEKDLPLALAAARADSGDDKLRVALLKGRTNYLCLRRLGVLLEHRQFELERSELRHFAEAVAWAVCTPDGDLDSFASAGRGDPVFISKLVSSGEECSGRACRYYRRCFLQKARARAAVAHVVIANHALVFSEAQMPGTTLPPYAQIIFDEAHNLEETATRHLSVAVSRGRLSQLMRRLSRGKGRRAGGMLEILRNHLEKGAVKAEQDTVRKIQSQLQMVKNHLDEAQIAARRFFERFYGLVEQRQEAVRFRCITDVAPSGSERSEAVAADAASSMLRREVYVAGAFAACDGGWDEQAALQDKRNTEKAICEAANQMRALSQVLREASEGELTLYSDQSANLDGAAAALMEFVADIDFVFSASDAGHVFWAEPAGRKSGLAELIAAPLNIAENLAAMLYRKKASVVFCSATLRVGASFNYIGRRLGIDLIEPERFKVCVAQSPFDYPGQCAVLAPVFLPDPSVTSGSGYAGMLSDLMREVFIRTRGRAMGLFTSYEMMNQVAQTLEPHLVTAGIRLLVQGVNGTRDQITRVFRSGQACVLLGTHSFWEGVDVAGEALSCVVLARLPFAVVNDPVLEARCEQIVSEGGSPFRELSLPQAVIRFRQGFGRLIRTRSDKGAVIIADPRIVTKNYGSTFKRSLPCPVLEAHDMKTLLAHIERLFPAGS
ncbi:MAG: helicase C-terminal domain-containing protein [Kiritimatiellae bacterium]|nr:helicase C-terminal domain-containing protein [Kiritimatiellia bacterium]